MSSRWPGSLINQTAPTSSGGGVQDSAPGVWTLDQANPYIANQTWPGTGTPDPQFQYVTALLHGDGTNAAQNNTFLDSSSNNFTITRNGTPTQGSFSPYGNFWSNYFSGSGQYIQSTASNATNLGTQDFTIECWVKLNAFTPGSSVVSLVSSFGSSYGWAFQVRGDAGALAFYYSGEYDSSAFTPTVGVWYNLAVCRSGNTLYFFVNGVSYGTTAFSSNINSNITTLNINGLNIGSIGQQGNMYLSNLRITVGTALYTSAYTPSTTPLTAISGTQLLTCQSNRFVDNSSNAYSLAITGTPSAQRFSPFQSLATYQTSKIGGSGYFDGSSSYLTSVTNAAFNFGSGAFTIEAFFYTASTGNQVIISAWNGSGGGNDSTSAFEIIYYAGTLYCQVASGTTATPLTTTTWPLNQWNHVVLVANGSTMSAYLNGVRFATTSFSSSVNNATYAPQIGTRSPGSSFPFAGYIASSRIVKGTAVYDPTQSTLTVPTAPLTNITNTSLLTNFTNGAIYDNAAMNDLQTVGNAQISTSVVKYGTGSMAFDGSGDGLQPNNQQNFIFGTGNFTIEFWVYLNTSSQSCAIYDSRPTSTSGIYPTIRVNSGVVYYYTNGSTRITGPTLAASTWYHIAVSRVGGTTIMFVNGNQVGTYADTNTYLNGTNRPLIGADGYDNFSGSNYLNGYVDDLRITNGYARYWFNFQPPAAPYPNYGGTLQLTYDPYFSNITLLLNGDGTNGSQNNTFLDSSTNNFTITRNGNTTQGSFSPYGSLWGNYFNGSSNLTAPSNSAYTFGSSGDFTIECWVYLTAAQPSPVGVLMTNYVDWNTGYNNYWIFQVRNGNQLNWLDSAGNNAITASSATAITYNFWNHVAIVRSGSTITMYINGTAVGTYSGGSQAYTGTNALSIGYVSGANYLSGYVSNARIVKGTAVYTSNFTPPTTPLTAITNTSILTCQSNRFIDNSSNNFTITAVGTPTVQRFSPFNPTSTYYTSVIGGSGYLATGGSDYLTVASNAAFCPGTSAFCVEFWYNKLAYGGNEGVMINTEVTGGLIITIAGGGIALSQRSTGNNLQSSANPIVGQWNHIVVCRDSSNNTAIFLNGVRVANSTVTANYTTGTLYIGNLPLSGYYATGYYSDVRIEKGSTPYNPTLTTLTVPTAPLTPITNTSLLTNYTNAGIPDLAMQNNLVTVGTSQVNTSVKKYGTGSLYFDGSGYLSSPTKPQLNFGTGPFTIEAWFYATSSAFQAIVSKWNATDNWLCTLTSGNAIQFYYNGGNISGGTFLLNTWNYYAVSRDNSGVIRLFLNGNQVATVTSAFSSAGSDELEVGNYANGAGGPFFGYIDDLRVTNGLARYVQPFTPPTAALPTY